METRLTPTPGEPAGTPPAPLDLLSAALAVGKRVLAGGSLAFQHYSVLGGGGLVGLAGALPGEVCSVELDGTEGWYAARDAFLAAEGSLEVDSLVPDIAATDQCSGIRGGGSIGLHFTGSGTLLLAGAGTVLRLNPATYGGTVQCDPGCLVAFSDRTRYRIERVAARNGSTAMAALLGAAGGSLATVDGDGMVLLQSMTVERLAEALAGYARQYQDEGQYEGKDRPLGGYLSGTFE